MAAFFFWLALSRGVYETTTPEWLSWHVLLRKIYSVGAFALVGYLYQRSRVELGRSRSPAAGIIAIGLYSAAIEIGQFAIGVREGLDWNALDVACGALGGFLSALVP